MTWISVKDLLPESNDWVLVFQQRNGKGNPSPISIGSFRDGNWENLYRLRGVYRDMCWEIDVKKITHWKPIPFSPDQLFCTGCNINIYQNHPKDAEDCPPICKECWEKRYDKID